MGNRIIKYLKFFWQCVLTVVYSGSESCIVCGNSLYEESYLCNICEEDIKFYKDSFYLEKNNIKIKVYSVAYYSRTMKKLVLKLKYKKNFGAGEAISYYMSKLILEKNIDIDIITFVPSSKEALKKRGYNQSEYLAKLIGENVNIPVIDSLRKINKTKDQIGLNVEERWNNVKNSFSIKNNDVKNKKILIIDDVVTTGATGFHCGYELIKNGAKSITILTAAKSRV